ncbi:DNA polymerase III subunit psi, partial [Xanthovirga aplysinae]|uniref:DNA polymerase III subunit psi n=1 Tax=Xanthovirga aplysinae TaxID=2529853 RepID=UPI0012BBEC0A
MSLQKSFLPLFIQEPIYVFDEDPHQEILNKEELPSSPASSAILKEQYENAEGSLNQSFSREKKRETLSFKGENKKRILVASEKMSLEEESLFSKILQSVKLTYSDIALVQIHSEKDLEGLNTIEYNIFLSFGVQSQAFPDSQINFYNIYLKEKKRFLLVDKLENLAKDNNKKAQL